MTLRPFVISAHRWLSLAAVAFWLVQALTGVFAVFHWEIDDLLVSGARRPTDFRAIERSVRDLPVSSIWTSAGRLDRYDVNLPDRALRIDGAGNILRTHLDGERFANGGFVETLVVLHQSLLSGDTGRAIVGFSGFLLASNLLLGILAAWPRRGQWRRALRPISGGSRVAVLYSWHRALGLWLVIPSLFLVTAGVLLAYEDSTERLLNAEPPPVEARPSAEPPRIGMADAIDRALARHPGSAVSGIRFPTAENAVWTLTIRQPGEPPTVYGKTRVMVSAADGSIVADRDALRAPAGVRVFNSLFAVHTGQIAGWFGRVVVLWMGVWLIAMIVLGVSLWMARRKTARR
jgi:uncharacterized iron-regulated membrane protein